MVRWSPGSSATSRGRTFSSSVGGAAQSSTGLAKLAALPLAGDDSGRQVEHGRRLMREAAVDFRLVHASAGHGRLPAASFDVVCGSRVTTFTGPYRTVPEGARLVRASGLFAFRGAVFAWVCWNAEVDRVEERLRASYFGFGRLEASERSLEYQLPYGEWIRLFRASELVVEDLVDVRPSDGARSTYRDGRETAWVRRWPLERVRKLRRDA